MTELTGAATMLDVSNDESPAAARMAVWYDELEQHQHSRQKRADTRKRYLRSAIFHIAPRLESVHGGSNTSALSRVIH
jgi:hypothetical protein